MRKYKALVLQVAGTLVFTVVLIVGVIALFKKSLLLYAISWIGLVVSCFLMYVAERIEEADSAGQGA